MTVATFQVSVLHKTQTLQMYFNAKRI